MFRRLFSKALLVLFGVLYLLNAPLYSQTVKAESLISKQPDDQHVLLASIQISMSVYLKTETESQTGLQPSKTRAIANGIGSLIESKGKQLLVTHNHWGDVLQEGSLVEFRDAQNELLLRLFGFEFKALIRRQDKGTLVLDVPESLKAFISKDCPSQEKSGTLVPGKPGNSQKVEPGDNVQVVYHIPGSAGQLAVIEAEVVRIDRFKDLPVFVLRSQNGQPVVEGDSGGGIWRNGMLVGNMWATLIQSAQTLVSQTGGASPGSNSTYTDSSLAAILAGSTIR